MQDECTFNRMPYISVRLAPSGIDLREFFLSNGAAAHSTVSTLNTLLHLK